MEGREEKRNREEMGCVRRVLSVPDSKASAVPVAVVLHVTTLSKLFTLLPLSPSSII